MIRTDETVCPLCGGELRYYDNVARIIRTKRRITTYIEIRRFKCKNCKKVHRELPDNVVPYKQYEKEIIIGVKEGLITSDTMGYEDYPCEATMFRWCNQD